MRSNLILFTCAVAACADLDAASTTETEVPGDPDVYLADGAIDEDLTGDMEEVELPVAEELARGMHRIRATDPNMTFFRRACHHGAPLAWDCPSDIDGRHAHFSHKHETGSNDTEVADNGGTFWGECVSLVKAATKNNAVTSTWRPGANVFAGLPAGTAIATFPGGRYSGHTAILMGYVRSGGSIIGIRVADQNWLARKVKRHIIRKTGTGVADAHDYFAVLVP